MAQSEQKKPQVLDLLGSNKKKKGAAPAAKQEQASAPAPAQQKKSAAPKKAALDLLQPQRKPKKQQEPAPAPQPVAKPAEQPKPVAKPAPAPKAKETPAPAAAGSTINVKAPVSVADLATTMGIKPFKLIAELLPMGVFANPSTTLDSDQVAALCEKHGFVYERVKREKGAGVKAPVEVVKEPEAVA
ncbi:MAG: translation initiation factor IF-2 N-terminal domain-containing protein, partial [Akkermansia sp.]|nr:translation initiation factor IF-2 N-terminal domain-containing protein [Akkermansia sp.]